MTRRAVRYCKLVLTGCFDDYPFFVDEGYHGSGSDSGVGFDDNIDYCAHLLGKFDGICGSCMYYYYR